MKKPGILFVLPQFEDGGIERILEIKAPWFRARGYPVEIRAGRVLETLGGQPHPIRASLAAAGVAVRDLPTLGSHLRLLQRSARLAAIAALGGFRILVGHELMANLEVVLAKRLLAGRVRAIVEVHNSIIYPDTGIDPRLHRWAQRLFNMADGIVAMSEGVAEDTAEFFAVDRSRIATIPNPFRLPDIRRRAAERPALDLEALGPYIVACGRFVKMKGFPTLIEALRLVRRKRPLSLVILGDGSLRAELVRCAEDAGVAEHVLMPGWLSNPFPVFAGARAFVLSSLYGESFSRVIVESMACGVPVISSRCRYGPEEVLDGGRYGLLYEPGDVDALAGAILRVLEDPWETAQRRDAALRRVEDFSDAMVLPRFEAYYVHGVANTEAAVAPGLRFGRRDPARNERSGKSPRR